MENHTLIFQIAAFSLKMKFNDTIEIIKSCALSPVFVSVFQQIQKKRNAFRTSVRNGLLRTTLMQILF